MKTLLLLLVVIGSPLAMSGTPIETLVPIDDVYVPSGFDTNDNSEIIVSGWLPNLCHKSPMTSVEIKDKTINIKVTALKYSASNPFCPEMIVPFLKSVSVGLLDKGDYKILVNDKTAYQKKSMLHVNESSSSAVDEHIYANVHYIEQDGYSRNVQLKGFNPSDCLELKEVKIVSNKSNTYSILPIMKKVRQFCPMKMMPFSYDVEVPKSLNKSKVLLHVRGMDGTSVNSIFDSSNY